MRVGDIIKQLRKAQKMTQAELAEKLKVKPTAVSAWERNENRPLMDKISTLAELFNVPITHFFEADEFGGQIGADVIMLPVVGRVSCGDGVVAFEDIEGHEPTPKEWVAGGDYFYLRAKGSSMTGARIYENDLLLIRKQPRVENGEIAAVLIGDEAVLKRVYWHGEQLQLHSENSSYPPIFVPPSEATIIGKLKMNVIKY